MAFYRVESLDSRPGEYGPAYGDCWRPVMPNRRYTREATALRIMAENVAALTAPAFRRGVTRVVEVDDADAIVRVIEQRLHGGGDGCPWPITKWTRGFAPARQAA